VSAAPKIGFVSLGCPKALVDSERILTRLRGEGYATSDTHEGADAVVVVTDHTTVDYSLVAEHAPLVVDTRGIMRGVQGRARMVGLSGRGGPVLRVVAA